MSDLLTRICAGNEIRTQTLELPRRVTPEMEVERAMSTSGYGVDFVLDVVFGDDVAANRTGFSASFSSPHSGGRTVRQMTFADQLTSAFAKLQLKSAQLWHFDPRRVDLSSAPHHYIVLAQHRADFRHKRTASHFSPARAAEHSVTAAVTDAELRQALIPNSPDSASTRKLVAQLRTRNRPYLAQTGQEPGTPPRKRRSGLRMS